MGRDIHVRIAKYNEETNKYDEICLYRTRNKYEKYDYDENGKTIEPKTPYVRVSVFSGRNSEMFDGMMDGNESDGYGTFPWRPIRMNSLEDSFKEKIQHYMDTQGYYDFHEISLTEIALYLKEHPKVSDYDADDKEWDDYWNGKGEKPVKDNLIKYLYDDICNYIYFADFLSYDLSDYKVIFYFDC